MNVTIQIDGYDDIMVDASKVAITDREGQNITYDLANGFVQRRQVKQTVDIISPVLNVKDDTKGLI